MFATRADERAKWFPMHTHHDVSESETWQLNLCDNVMIVSLEGSS